MSSDNENEYLIPSDISELADSDSPSPNVLPERSKKNYEQSYNLFMEWRSKMEIDSFSEKVLLDYFIELSKKYKISTLWTYYSMLRSTLNINHNVQIEHYKKLRTFLKRKGMNYQPKKARTLTPEEINTFITEAPDEKYLITKVALIMAITGACRSYELYSMQVQDIQDLNSAFIVTVPNTKTKVSRRFTITDYFYKVCKKYVDLRSVHNTTTLFFLSYQNGKCSSQRIGINKIGGMAKEVATYLQLPNPELYTGHCFLRSSATLLVDVDGDVTVLKRHGSSVSSDAEDFKDESLTNQIQARSVFQQVTTPQISTPHISTSQITNSQVIVPHVMTPQVITPQVALPQIKPSPSTSTSTSKTTSRSTTTQTENTANFNFDLQGIPLNFSNCSGTFTFNFYTNNVD